MVRIVRGKVGREEGGGERKRGKKKGKKSVDLLAMGFCFFFVLVLNLIFLFSQRIP